MIVYVVHASLVVKLQATFDKDLGLRPRAEWQFPGFSGTQKWSYVAKANFRTS